MDEAISSNQAPWLTIGKVLRTARAAMGLHGYQLAAKAGVHPSTISRLERGCHPPERKTLAAIVVALRPGLEETGTLTELLGHLASHGIDAVTILGDGGPPALHQAPGLAEPGDDASWESLYERGRQLNHQDLDYEAAIRVWQAALFKARDGAQRAAALAEEAYARWRLAEDGFEAALVKGRQAIAALDLDWTRVEAGTGRLPPAALTHLSDLGLKTYGLVAMRIGEALFERTLLAAAEGWFATAQEVGDLVGDPEAGWGARHFAMLCAFGRGTYPMVSGGWKPIDRQQLAQAHRYFQVPVPIAPHPFRHLQEAHDARWQARMLMLHGQCELARKAYDRAEALFGNHPDRAHVWRDRGLLALRDDDLQASRAYVLAALEGARRMKYPQLVADALRALSYLDAVAGTRAGRRAALAKAICALIVHPIYLDRAEGRVTIAFAVDLVTSLADDTGRFWRLYRCEVEEAIYAARAPFDCLHGLHTCDPIKPQVVDRTLGLIEARLMVRPSPVR